MQRDGSFSYCSGLCHGSTHNLLSAARAEDQANVETLAQSLEHAAPYEGIVAYAAAGGAKEGIRDCRSAKLS